MFAIFPTGYKLCKIVVLFHTIHYYQFPLFAQIKENLRNIKGDFPSVWVADEPLNHGVLRAGLLFPHNKENPSVQYFDTHQISVKGVIICKDKYRLLPKRQRGFDRSVSRAA